MHVISPMFFCPCFQCGFKDEAKEFSTYRVDGDLLLQLTEDNLKHDLNMNNGITRKRLVQKKKSFFIFAFIY